MVQPSASGTPNIAYLPQPTTAPAQNNNQVQPSPQPQPSGAREIATPLPPASSGPRDALLVAGIAVTLMALIVLALLYIARRRYYDPLLR
jgi:hypothetical protein